MTLLNEAMRRDLQLTTALGLYIKVLNFFRETGSGRNNALQ